ncbi:hypothetical protein Cs7R123_00140 [Catellatospora sp. TT07R-123]|uniref:VOC family protein n=1 Tax=Catellatospora sp. TT07R-123 TaxID=2733863 RepID=UPI001B2F65DD|nr:VOC family protein [Catellatospora sp. TT07R-123]GHJ42672.1 hypothetical protein Cs7R123_00140 [Catellatospora sp. TT07R-123]
MAANFQISVDCADPHALARFWAQALEWEVERHGDFIKQMLDAGHATPADVITLDGELVWSTAAAIRDPQAPVNGRGSPVRSRMIFQVVPEGKTAKNRFHLDVNFEGVDKEVTAARMEQLGAKRLWDGQQGPHSWIAMADPEGNEFCVS